MQVQIKPRRYVLIVASLKLLVESGMCHTIRYLHVTKPRGHFPIQQIAVGVIQ